jgi:uncharacterized protein
VRHVSNTDITGTVYLIQKLGRDMRAGPGLHPHHRPHRRVPARPVPRGLQRHQGVLVNSFSFALRDELKDSGVTVACLMPGATETDFFERAGMADTKAGTQEKDEAARVAEDGFAAMKAGEGDVVSGWRNKV